MEESKRREGADFGTAPSSDEKKVQAYQPDEYSKNKSSQTGNAYLVKNSRYLSRENRDPRLFRSPYYEDYLILKGDSDLAERLEKEYVLTEVFDELAKETPKVRDLTTKLIWRQEELKEKTQKLLEISISFNVPIERLKNSSDHETVALYNRCETIQVDIRDIAEQIHYIQTRSKPEEIWPDPLPFSDELLPADKFDLTMLPEPLRKYAQDAANRIQCPIEFVAIGLMVVFSAIVGAGCAIRPHKIDDWTVIPNLWGAAVGNPSTKKSPALNAALLPLGALEQEARKDFKKRKKQNEIDKTERILREKTLKNALEVAIKGENVDQIENIKAKLLLLGEEDATLCLKRFKTNSATIEKLQEILQANPRGILQFNDELMGFLASLEKEGREDSRAFFLEGWNGWASSPFQTDRIARGETSCNPCISVLGGIPPSKLQLYLQDVLSTIGNDGFIQRFQLLVYPDSPQSWTLVDQAPNIAAQETVIEVAQRLAITDFLEFGGRQEGDFPLPIFRFSADAQKVFHTWLGTLETRLLKELGDGLIAQHLSKYRKLLPSLSLINYLVRAAAHKSPAEFMRTISIEDISCAERFCKFLESHARRVYSMIDRRGIFCAKILLNKIQNRELRDGFTCRDVSRPKWSGITTSEAAKEACDELVEHHWIKEEPSGITTQVGRPTIRYRIHPALQKRVDGTTDETAKTKE